MHDLFISYGRADEDIARLFASTLQGEGFSVWWDETLRSGDTYDEVIEKALRQAPAVVVLWSASSVQSRWVRSEATIGDRHGALVPAMISPCERPIMFELTQTADLTGWNGDRSDPRWQAFVSDIREVVERRKSKDGADTEVIRPQATAHAPPPLPPQEGVEGELPSLAVLPFKNRSGLEDDDVFAIGLVEDVIDALSQAAELRVISSSAVARYRDGEIADIEAMARSLGVRYILEGNVRRRMKSLRVTAQLLDARSGTILWTQKFERPLDELAELEEELVLEVAAHLNSQVNRLEMERALKKPENLTAWELVTRAVANYRQITGETLLLALQDAQKAVEIAPSYGLAHAMLADANATIYMHASPDDPGAIEKINAEIGRALSLDPDNPMVLAHVAEAYNYIGQPEDALIYAQRALEKSPNFGLAHYNAGIAHALLHNADEALEQFDLEIVQAPGAHTQFATYVWKGSVHLRDGKLAEARRQYDRALRLNHTSAAAYLGLFLVDKHEGNHEQAADNLAKMREHDPQVTLDLLQLRLQRWFGQLEHCDQMCDWAREHWDAEGAPG
ncbi:TIR domain-containing protein [Erythrobacter aquimaris]|uniref:TIR domain-containing protein n=1 Tax=Qipengyuania aquimaris TaxID=255984 RepID=A0A6I4TIX2_9SPHN|nr:TIR domain-containing protein [Qipengyuania aquimaris]MXO94941.1 TIR domain-containing protein [Qipengyuania aquimaris]